MKFFLPYATDEAQAESVYAGIKKFAAEQTGWPITDRRIRSIEYRHEGKEYTAEVGEVNNRNGETVIAILESKTYLVCTPNRCVRRGEPMYVGIQEVSKTETFE